MVMMLNPRFAVLCILGMTFGLALIGGAQGEDLLSESDIKTIRYRSWEEFSFSSGGAVDVHIELISDVVIDVLFMSVEDRILYAGAVGEHYCVCGQGVTPSPLSPAAVWARRVGG